MKTNITLRLYDLTNLRNGIASMVEDLDAAIAVVGNDAEVLHTLETLIWELRDNINFTQGMVDNLKGDE